MSEETPSTEDTPSVEVAFDLLSNRRRRTLLAVLQSHGTSLSLADAAEEVAVKERGKPFAEIPPEEVKRVYMALYHTHVPKLEDHGIVSYDQERDVVAPTGRIDPLISVADEFPGVRSDENFD